MRGLLRHALLIGLFGSLLGIAQAGDKVAAFTALPEGAELEMVYASTGCFHAVQYELKFLRSPELEVRIVQVESEWSVVKQAHGATNRVELGKLKLTKADEEGLDRLMKFYRSKPGGGCTTVNFITVSQRQAGTVIATEQFTDKSCSHRDDVTWVTDLVRRLQVKK